MYNPMSHLGIEHQDMHTPIDSADVLEHSNI